VASGYWLTLIPLMFMSDGFQFTNQHVQIV